MTVFWSTADCRKLDRELAEKSFPLDDEDDDDDDDVALGAALAGAGALMAAFVAVIGISSMCAVSECVCVFS